MQSKDLRIEKTSDYLKCGADGIILFTLNIPGNIKDSPLYRKVFRAGIRAVTASFRKNKIEYSISEISFPEQGTGPEAYITSETPISSL